MDQSKISAEEAAQKARILADDRRNLLERARLSEEAARWQDMVSHMRAIVLQGRELSVEERNLLANAYKNFVGEKRAAWRVISSIEQKIEVSSRKKDLSKEYKQKIEDELRVACNELLGIIDKYLVKTIDVENQIFYKKMQGDYYRYLAEFCVDTASDHVFDNAKVAYGQAYGLAREHLSPAHPLRLGLVLNFSVFHYEILECYDVACDLARESVALGEEDLPHLVEKSRKDSAVLLQLLKDNIRIWSMDLESSSTNQGKSTRASTRICFQ